MRIYTCVCVCVCVCVSGLYTLCVCVCVCVYDCSGSQRVTEPEFDEGTTVVSKGGWGSFPSITFSVSHKLCFYFMVLFFWGSAWFTRLCIS